MEKRAETNAEINAETSTETGTKTSAETKERDLSDLNSFQPTSVEDCFARVDELLGKLEGDSATLEDSFRMYREGMQLLQTANSSIDEIEKQLRILTGEDSEDDGI